MLITAALAVAIPYAVVALLLLTGRLGLIVWLYAVPLLIVSGILIFAGHEPSDQTTVHSPPITHTASDVLAGRLEHSGRSSRGQASAQPRDAPNESSIDAAHEEQDFIELVRRAIDELPPNFAHALDHVGVVVSDQGAVQRINGRRQPLYGLYVGYGGRSSYVIGASLSSAVPDRIVIFRDTLVHDYGNDPIRLRQEVTRTLRQEVTRTLRHELAHHLGWDEPGVQNLGL